MATFAGDTAVTQETLGQTNSPSGDTSISSFSEWEIIAASQDLVMLKLGEKCETPPVFSALDADGIPEALLTLLPSIIPGPQAPSEGTLHPTLTSGNFLSSLRRKVLLSELVNIKNEEARAGAPWCVSPAPTPHPRLPFLLSFQVNAAQLERHLQGTSHLQTLRCPGGLAQTSDPIMCPERGSSSCRLRFFHP